MQEGELSKSLKFALFLLGLFSVLPILVGAAILFSSIIGVASYQAKFISVPDVGLQDSLSYFGVTGIGFGLYLVGRGINFLGSMIETVNLQIETQAHLKNKLLLLGQEACFILTFTGLSAFTLSLIDFIVQQRPLICLTIIIIWAIIIATCLTVIYFIGKHITNEGEYLISY